MFVAVLAIGAARSTLSGKPNRPRGLLRTHRSADHQGQFVDAEVLA